MQIHILCTLNHPLCNRYHSGSFPWGTCFKDPPIYVVAICASNSVPLTVGCSSLEGLLHTSPVRAPPDRLPGAPNFHHHRQRCNEHSWHTQVSLCTVVSFRWPYRRGPGCRWCHLEGVRRFWGHCKRRWDTSRHQGQRSERAPRNGQTHGQRQETSGNLECKHVWWMAPCRSKGGGNEVPRNAASGKNLPGETAFPCLSFLLSLQRNGNWKESR